MKCLFHKWSDWKIHTNIYHFNNGRSFKVEEIRKVRVCQKCGKTQSKIVGNTVV